MPLNRIAWLFPLTLRCVTLFLTSLKLSPPLFLLPSLLLLHGLEIFSSSKTHGGIRNASNSKNRKYVNLLNEELNRADIELNKSKKERWKYIQRIGEYNQKIRENKNEVYWRISFENLAFSVGQRLVIVWFLAEMERSVVEKFATLIVLERFIKSLREILGHYLIHLPRETEAFTENVNDLYAGVPSSKLVPSRNPLLPGDINLDLSFDITLDKLRIKSSDLKLSSSNIYIIRGDNGSGKSTFLKLLNGEIFDSQTHSTTYSLNYSNKAYVHNPSSDEIFFNGIFQSSLIIQLDQSSQISSSITYGDYFVRFNSFCSPTSLDYMFSSPSSETLGIREWLRTIISYVLSVSNSSSRSVVPLRTPRYFGRNLSERNRKRFKEEIKGAVKPRIIMLDEPDKEIDVQSINSLLSRLWQSIDCEGVLKFMITHTELTGDGDFDDTKEEVSFKIEDLGERIGEKSGGEKQRLRLAGVFFRIIVLQALHYDDESERGEEDEEETAEFKVLKFNVERKGLEKISTMKEMK
ncbi:hypothetical protein TrVE_jg4148 [Triparma verrucosa]|uniref:ABC transporter domain-containing protein n=1 Tax=Triparma verrucosa TaxID=1606542 RepID=A0A9W7BHB8_9STRA|nr:hypothetical protein TrVE_jg4148 [Triparma verrucosa]